MHAPLIGNVEETKQKRLTQADERHLIVISDAFVRVLLLLPDRISVVQRFVLAVDLNIEPLGCKGISVIGARARGFRCASFRFLWINVRGEKEKNGISFHISRCACIVFPFGSLSSVKSGSQSVLPRKQYHKYAWLTIQNVNPGGQRDASR